MKVFSKIDPCPITEAIMEVRFDSSFDEAAVFGVLYNKIKSEFHKTRDLPVLQLPAIVRKKDPNLTFQPYYRLESKTNENTLIQVGPRVFSVIVTNRYSGWSDFLKDIDYGLSRLEQSQVVSKITRLALRYVNFFEGVNILTNSNLSMRLNDQLLNERKTQLRFEIPDGEFMNTLVIHNHSIMKDKTKIKTGSLIDIDTYVDQELPEFFGKRQELLENCHYTEKKLFTSLLAGDYLKTFNEVTYA